jgi:RNA polymerase sigma-70 factor, ECF subfamily
VIGAAFGVVLARAQAGDEAAFARLFADVQPALLRYLRVITPEADDVAGDTWLQVVTGLRGFRGEEEAFRAWLFTIARHRAADAARSRARRPAVPVAVPEAAQGLTVQGLTAQGLTAQGLTAGQPLAPDAADLALDGISARAVVALIATLPRDQAEVVMLRVVAGLEVADVARIVGKSPGAVRVAAHRGLRRLAARLERASVTP